VVVDTAMTGMTGWDMVTVDMVAMTEWGMVTVDMAMIEWDMVEVDMAMIEWDMEDVVDMAMIEWDMEDVVDMAMIEWDMEDVVDILCPIVRAIINHHSCALGLSDLFKNQGIIKDILSGLIFANICVSLKGRVLLTQLIKSR